MVYSLFFPQSEETGSLVRFVYTDTANNGVVLTARATNNVTDLPLRDREIRERALERLFKEHGAALRAFLRVRTGSEHEADDIAQEVFARLARLDNLLERLPSGAAGNRSYIFTVANNLIVDIERRKVLERRYRESQSRKTVDTEDQQFRREVDLSTPESCALASEDIARLKAVIKQLKPVWRDAFIFIRVDGLSYREAASRMGVSFKQVERYLTSALTQIRKAAIGCTEEDKP